MQQCNAGTSKGIRKWRQRPRIKKQFIKINSSILQESLTDESMRIASRNSAVVP